MDKRQIPWAFFGLLLVGATTLGTLEAFRFLWVFPLDAAGLPLWIVVCGVDVLLASFALSQARLLLWCAGLLYFTARQDVPFVGVALILSSSALWVAGKLRLNFLPLAAAIAVPLFVIGHDGALLHPGMVSRLGDFRFSCHLLASFAAFRMISWIVAVRARGERPSFYLTMEYFLAPAFWLNPMHAAHLLFDHMQPPEVAIPKSESFWWLVRGFFYSLVFSLVVSLVLPRVEARFISGVSSFEWWEWALLGPVLFLAAYLEKSRVSYLVAGLLSLSGHDVRPDFRSPWLSRNLLEYWRRFHSWMWEYYVELIYLPLSQVLSRRLSPRMAGYVALFFTFSLGTSLIHWLHYPAPLSVALALGTLFGVFTVVHGFLLPWLEDPRFGIPFTWLSVFLLYTLAYPSFGLGWGVSQWMEFLRH